MGLDPGLEPSKAASLISIPSLLQSCYPEYPSSPRPPPCPHPLRENSLFFVMRGSWIRFCVQDLLPGKIVSIFNHRFEMLDMDEYTRKTLENPDCVHRKPHVKWWQSFLICRWGIMP